jgi:hypothetical protein
MHGRITLERLGRHSGEHGNPWMPDQVGHDGMAVGMPALRRKPPVVIPVQTGIQICLKFKT